jgi:hypothetical protein
MSDTADQSNPTTDEGADLDVDAERERLDDLGKRIETTRQKAADDLGPEAEDALEPEEPDENEDGGEARATVGSP